MQAVSSATLSVPWGFSFFLLSCHDLASLLTQPCWFRRPSRHQLPMAPQLRRKLMSVSPIPARIIDWIDLVQIIIAPVSSWVQWPCHVQKTEFHSIPPQPPALNFFPPSLPDVPWALWELIWMYYWGLSIQKSLILCTLTFGFSVLIVLCLVGNVYLIEAESHANLCL